MSAALLGEDARCLGVASEVRKYRYGDEVETEL